MKPTGRLKQRRRGRSRSRRWVRVGEKAFLFCGLCGCSWGPGTSHGLCFRTSVSVWASDFDGVCIKENFYRKAGYSDIHCLWGFLSLAALPQRCYAIPRSSELGTPGIAGALQTFRLRRKRWGKWMRFFVVSGLQEIYNYTVLFGVLNQPNFHLNGYFIWLVDCWRF